MTQQRRWNLIALAVVVVVLVTMGVARAADPPASGVAALVTDADVHEKVLDLDLAGDTRTAADRRVAAGFGMLTRDEAARFKPPAAVSVPDGTYDVVVTTELLGITSFDQATYYMRPRESGVALPQGGRLYSQNVSGWIA